MLFSNGVKAMMSLMVVMATTVAMAMMMTRKIVSMVKGGRRARVGLDNQILTLFKSLCSVAVPVFVRMATLAFLNISNVVFLTMAWPSKYFSQ